MYTDGREVFFGWLETYDPLEDLLFYDMVEKSWPEGITHWAHKPVLPKEIEA